MQLSRCLKRRDRWFCPDNIISIIWRKIRIILRGSRCLAPAFHMKKILLKVKQLTSYQVEKSVCWLPLICMISIISIYEANIYII